MNYTQYQGSGEKEVLTSRPCFACGEMMEIDRIVKQLACRACEVTESCSIIQFPPRTSGTVETGQWQGVTFLDHAQIHAPSPLCGPSPS